MSIVASPLGIHPGFLEINYREDGLAVGFLTARIAHLTVRLDQGLSAALVINSGQLDARADLGEYKAIPEK